MAAWNAIVVEAAAQHAATTAAVFIGGDLMVIEVMVGIYVNTSMASR